MPTRYWWVLTVIAPVKQVIEKCEALGIKPANQLLVVHVATQTLQHYRDGALVRAYAISTSLRPPSSAKGSLGTPLGLHAIAEKIGHGQPPGMVFQARVSTGRHFSEFGSEERIGTPQSAGCVVMRNLDVVELFEEIRTGDQVWIAE